MKQQPVILLPEQKEYLEQEIEKMQAVMNEIESHFEGDVTGGADFISKDCNLKESLLVLESQRAILDSLIKNAVQPIKKEDKVIQIGSLVTLKDIETERELKFQVLGTVCGGENEEYETVTAGSTIGQMLLRKERKEGDAIVLWYDGEYGIYIATEVKYYKQPNNKIKIK